MDSRFFMLNVEKDPAKAKRIAIESAKRIERKEVKLLDLVQSLGEYLTDEDTTVRAKEAIAYLAAVLGCLDPKSLSRQQVAVIAQFLCDRLDDETGLKETAQGLIALQSMQRFGKEEAVLVASTLCKVDLPKHPQGTRFVVLTLLDGLMSNQRDALKSMGDKFVTRLVDLVGGEKDPRNLMIVFSVVKVVLVEFDIVAHTELLFDVVYCYFPITFRPPPDDPYGITAQDLKERLRECISATRYFAGQVFPQLIEKLDSTSQNVKKDVLQTITACALSYGAQTISTQSSQLWDAIKFEVLNSAGEDELADEALLAMKAIATSLSFGLKIVPPPTSPLARYLKNVSKECMKLLQEPQQKQAKPAGQILATVATASAAAYAYIIQNTLPDLLVIYSDVDGISKQRALMEVLNGFLESTIKIYGIWGDMMAPPTIENPLSEFREKLFEMYSQVLMGSTKEETSFRITALKGLARLCKIRNFLEESEVGMVVQYFDEVVLEEEEKEEIKEEALQGLKDISRLKPSLIMDITFPAFMAQLPDAEEEKEGKPYVGTLEALAKLSFERPVFEVLLTRLLNKLDMVLLGGSGPEYPRAILSTILYVLQNKPESALEDIKAYYSRLVPSLLTKTTLPLVDSSQDVGLNVLANDEVLDIIGRLVNIIVRAMDIESQKSAVEQMFNLFIRNVPSELIKEKREHVAKDFRPFDKDAKPAFSGTIVIFTCALAGTRREVPLPVDNTSAFLEQNVQSAQHPKSPAHRLAHLRLIGGLVNKWSIDSDFLRKLTDNLLASISCNNSSESSELISEKLRIVFWIAKALVLKADNHGMEITGKLIDLLGDDKYGAVTSRGFAVLLGEDECLNKANFAVARLLAKQRVFSFCVPKIIEGFKTATSGTKPNFLIALSNILRNVPSSVILPELPNLIPLLLQSLDLSDVDIKAATIETIYVTILESTDAIKEHISSLVTRLLNACTNRGENPPRVRTAALRCLRGFPGTMRGELLLPHKRQILRSLMVALDDPKRAVRKEAVDCRSKWFDMDEPE
ncbi:hypothetical protein RUND412_009827 [Rhizina undulata]